MMEEKDLDLLLTYSDDKATAGAAHSRYLAGFAPHFEPVCIVVPPYGDPHLLTGPESEEYAKLTGKMENVHSLSEFTHPDEDYPYTLIKSFSEIIGKTEDISRIKRIGVGGLDFMPVKTYTALKKAISSAEWVDSEADLCSLRAIKSPAEIEVIKRAYHIAEKGMEAAVASAKPGMVEREIAAEAEYVMRRAGSEGVGIDTIVASGANSRPILARTTQRKISRDDLVVVTLAPRYEGYHGAVARPILIGNPGDEIRRAAEAAYLAQEECRKLLRPGVEGRSVEAVGRATMAKTGLGEHFLYSGLHSVGVVEFEPPIFGPKSNEIIRENMVISIDIPVFNAPWGGLRVETGYLITSTGYQILSTVI